MVIRFCLIALLSVGLSSCGFTPLYSTVEDESIAEQLQDVHVVSLDGPPDPARYLRDSLRDILTGTKGENARYQLQINLKDQRRSIAVTQSADTTRFDYYLNASYVLTDTDTGQQRRQNINTILSYGIVASQYSSLVGREDTVRRAANELGRKIELDLALFMKGRAPTGGNVSLPDEFGGELIEGLPEGSVSTAP
ncbi:MAG: LPS assembly lipoprotein LptE [Pseudomonadota bacterium]